MSVCHGCLPAKPEPTGCRTHCTVCGGWMAPEVVDWTDYDHRRVLERIVQALLANDDGEANRLAVKTFKAIHERRRDKLLASVPR